MNKVWTAAIATEHGVDVLGVFKTEAKAIHAVYEYVKRCWDEIDGWYDDDAHQDEFPLKPPKDEQEAITMYFENHEPSESYDVSPHEVEV